MSGLPYFPMYPTDFEADTSHLTMEEDGAYNRLLRLLWLTPGCSLPDDPEWIARRMRIDTATFDRVVAPLLDEFFKRSTGRIYSPRLRSEYQKADETYKRRSEAGKKGGRPKAIDNKGKEAKTGLSQSKAGPKQPEPEPEPLEKETPNGVSKKRGLRLPEDWLPDEVFARQEGLSASDVSREADTHGTGSLIVGSAGAHTHSMPLGGDGGSGGSARLNAPSGTQNIIEWNNKFSLNTTSAQVSSAGAHTHSLSGSMSSSGSGSAHNNVQPTAILNKIIRAI